VQLGSDLVGLPAHLEGYGLTGDPQRWRAWALCQTQPDGGATTANLRAPLLFHPTTHRGGQIILDDPRLSMQYRLVAPSADTAIVVQAAPSERA
jgi:hypothetical protein